jgi:hypothetical protein
MPRLQLHSVRLTRCFLCCVIALCMCSTVVAWSPATGKAFQSVHSKTSTRRVGFVVTDKKTSQKPNLTEQKMLRNPSNPNVRDSNKKSTTKLSHSVLADCDTLPSFPTAHGLLSPETVMLLEDHSARNDASEALVTFLDQYRRNGPLSCLHMLSDPEILPHLTRAMREITA